MYIPVDQQARNLDAISAAEFATSHWHLVKTNLSDDDLLNATVCLASGNEADFAGYLRFAVTGATTSLILQDGSVALLLDEGAWVASGASPANTIYAWVITNTADNLVRFAGRFDPPLQVNAHLDAVGFVLPLKYMLPTAKAVQAA